MSPSWVLGCPRKRMSRYPPGQRMPGEKSPGGPEPLVLFLHLSSALPRLALPPFPGLLCALRDVT